MSDTLLDYIIAAAGHELMGENSLVASAATGGSATTLVDTANLLTQVNDETWKNRWVYFWSGANAGQDRFVSSVAGQTGTLTWTSALSNAVQAGDEYLLFRDFRFGSWVRFANETLKNIFYPLEFYLRGQTDQQLYSLPAPISEGRYIVEVRRGPYPFRFTNDRDRQIRWYRIEPRFMTVEQQIYLSLESVISVSEQLLFECQVPYAHPHMSTFTMTRSVVTPFGETVAVDPPRHLVVLGMVWRALVQKEQNLTGTAKQIWRDNRRRAAQRYAEALAASGVTKIGLELQYANRW